MIFRLVLSFLACWLLTGAATDVLTIDKDPTVVELIVKIDRSAYGEASPALVIASVAKANSGTEILSPIEAALVQRFSTPQSARWLLDHRQPNEYLDSLRKVDPDHPELHLQEFIVLAYTFAQDRMTAHARLATDKAVSSVIDNSRETFSARVNDFYVQSTGPSAAPARYQYGLESMKTMSPYSNPGQLSGWDLAIGYGYVAVVDSGIAPTHGDLQRTFRPHMSQAFYTSACPTSNLTNVDEQGPFLPGSECFSGMVGHGTHVAGIVGASTHNGIGVAGICVDCSLIIAKIRQGNNAFSSSIINGIYHGIIRGAQVINRSGGSYYIEGAHGAGKHNCSDVAGDDGFCLVLALAERREVVLVAASGNNNNATMGTEFPAREPNVVSVAGTTYPNDDLWASDQNPCCAGSDTTKVDFVAPAKRVMSTFYPGGSWAPANCSDILNDGNNGFDECTGTSMAAPHVAATIAVVRSVNPLLSRYAVVDLVRQSARTVAISSTYPNGFKMPSHVDGVIAAHYTNGSITPVFAMANVESSVAWNRYFTVAPQMAVAGITGTMLPTLNGSSTPVYYIPDQNAPVVSGYALPDAGAWQPRAYFKVYTQMAVYGVGLLPLYRFSKLQDTGAGIDECGYAPPVPAKPKRVLHSYTTSETERAQLTSVTYGNCFRFDGIEGYVAPYNLGGMQQLYRVYNPTKDAYILVPSAYVASATAQGFTQNTTALGWVFAN